MNARNWKVYLLITLSLTIASTASAQVMDLVAPDVGWANWSPTQLLWTTTGGKEWNDITPPLSGDARISSPFFLDTKRGWVVLVSGPPDEPGARFDLASTEDAGATWSISHISIPEREYWRSDVLHGGYLAFSDSAHGWLGLRAGMSIAHQGMGVLLATSDGGKSWSLATKTGWEEYDEVGPMLMLTPQHGWVVEDGADGALRVTRDGGQTWRTVELTPPTETEQMHDYQQRLDRFEASFKRPRGVGASGDATAAPRYRTPARYGLPTFKDHQHGYLTATFPGETVLFKTDDGGTTWKPDRMLERAAGPSAVMDSTWITIGGPRDAKPQLRNIGPGVTPAASTYPGPQDEPAAEVSFASEKQGWVFRDGKLLSTSDGGTTWTDISPIGIARVVVPQVKPSR